MGFCGVPRASGGAEKASKSPNVAITVCDSDGGIVVDNLQEASGTVGGSRRRYNTVEVVDGW
jgi:hypothetical protein